MLNNLKVKIFGGKPTEERRRVPRTGIIPAVNGHIAKQQVVLKITDAMTTDLWEWLVLMGWREINIKTNRRKVRLLPENTFAKFAHASFSEGEAVYRELLK